MFTGLIEDIGVVRAATNTEIKISCTLSDIKTGDSIAVNGVCLTVTKISGQELSFDYSPQTDKLTTMSALRPGAKVNLERALKLSSRLGGHIVSGHADGKAKVVAVVKLDNFYKFTFLAPAQITKYIAAKGSVTIDGVSLTVANIKNTTFDIFVIPETYKNTTLAQKRVGEEVNIETDILAKYTEKLLQKKPLDENFFKEAGF